MFVLDAAAVLLVIAAAFGLANHRILRLPFAIGMLVSGLLASIGVMVIDRLLPSANLADAVREAVLQVDFADAVLSGMLSLLLFAGALHTDLGLLRSRLSAILSLATIGEIGDRGVRAFEHRRGIFECRRAATGVEISRPVPFDLGMGETLPLAGMVLA